MFKEGSAVDATLVTVTSSTKDSGDERNPEMHETKKGNSGTSV